MALLDILRYPDPKLYRRAVPVLEVDESVRALVRNMAETMYAAPGVGLAATQVDVNQRVIVIDASETRDELLVLINPEIVEQEGSQTSEEGCLSLPTFREPVRRPRKVTVRASNAKGAKFEITGEDLLARALLHETDHLNGTLYINYISPLKRDLIRRKIRKLQKAGEW